MTTHQLPVPEPDWPATPPTGPPLFDPGRPRLAVPPSPLPSHPQVAPRGAPPRAAGPSAVRPARPRRTGAIVGLAVVMALVVGLGAGFALARRSNGEVPVAAAPSTTGPRARPAPSTTTDPADPSSSGSPGSGSPGTGSSGAPASIEDAVSEIEDFVEADRGLEFQHDVEVTVLDDAAFEQTVRDQVVSSTDAMEQQGELLKAAGLLPASFDVVQGQLDLLAAGVLGFYDPKTKALVVRGGSEVTPFLRQILAHELTHALDDQHVSLDRPELEHVTDGRDFAFLALVEGSAKRVENDYVATFDAQEQQELQQEMLAMGLEQLQTLSDVPMVLPRLQMAPYDYGEPFAEALVARGGTAALDAALRDLPTTSEQILDPPRYDAREGALAVARPPADGEVVQDGSLGQLMTGFLLHGGDDAGLGGLGDLGDLGAGGGLDPELLEELLELFLGGDLGDLDAGIPSAPADPSPPTDPVDPADPAGPGGLGGLDLGATGFPPIETVAGWGGDHYVVYRAGGQRCLRVDWRMDTPAALEVLDGELRAWAADDPAVLVVRPADDVVRATRCSAI